MEHNTLSLEYDKSLIEKTLDDINSRYIILFLYVIRNDLFKNLVNQNLVKNYARLIALDEIFKSNITNLLSEDFIRIFIDLGVAKNLRSYREFENLEEDFIVKLGVETITIEEGLILTPDDLLFLIINKKFKDITRRNFNLALTRLKSVRCEKTGVIHPFIYQIRENDYTLSDDLYLILEGYGNIYQTIKIEFTIDQFYQRFEKIREKLIEFIEIYDPNLSSKAVQSKVVKAQEENKDVVSYLKEEKIKLSDKFNYEKLKKDEPIFQKWLNKLKEFFDYLYSLKEINNKLEEIISIFSGAKKQNSYLEFIEKVSFNEEDIVDKIQNNLIELREHLITIDDSLRSLTKKDVKLLNLDYERYLLMATE